MWQVLAYVCGFPCKAFSALRHTSQWLKDDAAKPFYYCRDTIRSLQPPASCPLHYMFT